MSYQRNARIESLEEYSPARTRGGWIKDEAGEIVGATLVEDRAPHSIPRRPGESIPAFRARVEKEGANLAFLDYLSVVLDEMLRVSSGEEGEECPVLRPK